MEGAALSPRLRRLPRVTVLGFEVRVALGLRARLLGLALLDRHRAGGGLLIPACSSVHTFGMRFPLDLLFLDREGTVVAAHRSVGRCRIVSCRTAAAVLELSSARRGDGDQLL